MQLADPELALQMLVTGAPMRQGRKVGRTLYLQISTDPDDEDLLIGLMDSPELATYVMNAVNARRGIDG